MNLVLLLLSSVHLLNADANYTAGQWIKVNSSTERLPRKDDQMAVGVWNGSIFILGGWNYREALLEWNIFANTMTDYGSTHLSAYTYGRGQYWIQQEDILYMIQYPGDTFSIFNLRTKQFTDNYHNITIPIGVSYSGCLASYGELLYVLGGWTGTDGMDTVQIVNVSSNRWISGGATMQTKRGDFACIVHESDALFAIGGTNGGSGATIKSVEKLMVNNNDTNSSWEYIDDLLYSASGVSAFSFGHDILVIGGSSTEYQGGNVLDVMQVIDTASGHISFGVNMNFGVVWPAVIYYNNIIYSFGGINCNIGCFQWNWQYYELPPTNHPTRSPSPSPTQPTSTPSQSPSDVPSYSPSKSPTNAPSHLPSNTPSHSPSQSPSAAPSYSPSAYPTNTPTKAPSESPSVSPTETPTISSSVHPTNALSYLPSNAPSHSPSDYPTNIPSVHPSNAPSYSPSDYSSYPTSNVPFNTTLYSTFYVSTNEPTANIKDASTDNANSNTLRLMIIIIIIICLFC